MIDEKKTKAYHEKVMAKISRDCRTVDYYTQQANTCKRLYVLTKDKGGIYRLLHRWAKRKNRHYCEKGTELALKNLIDCIDEIEYLNNYSKSFEKES